MSTTDRDTMGDLRNLHAETSALHMLTRDAATAINRVRRARGLPEFSDQEVANVVTPYVQTAEQRAIESGEHALPTLRGVPVAMQAALTAVAAEYTRAKLKHGPHTLDGNAADDMLRLSALGEEYGEVCEALTYDKRAADAHEHEHHLRTELIQVANLALTWASILE